MHASAPQTGINPNYSLARFLLALRDMPLRSHPVYGGTQMSQCDLHDIVTEVATHAREWAGKVGLTLNVDVAPDAGKFLADGRRLRQITVPEPTSSPSCQPSSIGPPLSTIAGMSTVLAAMIWLGVVLSQPVVSTTPSIG